MNFHIVVMVARAEDRRQPAIRADQAGCRARQSRMTFLRIVIPLRLSMISAQTRFAFVARANAFSFVAMENRRPPPGARAIAYDQLRPTLVASHNLSAGRPCERRDPSSPLASKVKKGLCSSAETRVRAAAMSAIALTLGSLRSQGRLIENSICDSPALAGRGRSDPLRFNLNSSRSS